VFNQAYLLEIEQKRPIYSTAGCNITFVRI